MTKVHDADPGRRRLPDRPAPRPMTKFERQGIQAGRPIVDLAFARE